MTLARCIERGCMRLGTTGKHESRRQRKAQGVELPASRKNCDRNRKRFTRKEISELLFENCIDCAKMSAIPQGAFAACKVRGNLERNILISSKDEKEKPAKESLYNSRPPLEGWELTPLKYNSKLMNSIWGLYNRYSVHNFKKNTDSDEGVRGMFAAAWGAVYESRVPAANAVAAAAATAKNSPIIPKGHL